MMTTSQEASCFNFQVVITQSVKNKATIGQPNVCVELIISAIIIIIIIIISALKVNTRKRRTNERKSREIVILMTKENDKDETTAKFFVEIMTTINKTQNAAQIIACSNRWFVSKSTITIYHLISINIYAHKIRNKKAYQLVRQGETLVKGPT